MTVTETPLTSAPAKGASHTAMFLAPSRAMVKGFIRDRTTMLFTILVPLMFLVIFGLLFADRGESRMEVGVVGEGPVITSLRESHVLDLTPIETVGAAEQRVRSGDLPAYVMQRGDTVTLRYAASDRTPSGAVLAIVDGIVNRANVAATGQRPQFALESTQVEDTSLQAIQYMVPGIMSWAVSIAAVFGAALTFVNWRRKQVLRRLRLAPVSGGTVLSSRLLVSLGVAVLQFAVFVGVGSLPVFGLQLTGQWWLAIPLLLLGTLSFFAIGMLVGAFCKTEEAAGGVANIITLPMAFLSGAFFPLEAAPQWLRDFSVVLPMRHLNEGMLDVMVRGQGAQALLMPALVLLGFTVVVGFVASRVLRWED